jgi:hypothetical protein
LKKMTRREATTSSALAGEICHQLGSPGVARYLSSLRTFSVEPGLPERLRDLLGELQRAEAHRQRNGGRRADRRTFNTTENLRR